jgi:cytochrome c oxidase subunit 2
MASKTILGSVCLLGAVALVAPLPATAQADRERGEALFDLCTQCHGPEGGGNEMTLAPSIAGMTQWYVESQLHNFRKGIRGSHPDDVGGMRMRPMSLTLASDEDVAAVAAYVASLPPARPEPVLEGGDPQRGQAIFTPCVACHGADGAGNESLHGAPLRRSSDWYLFTQLHNFKSGVRGTNPADAFGALMRPMAATLADDQAMLDVIAYIMTLADDR